MIRKITIVLFLLIFIAIFSINTFAETVNLYANLDDSSSYCNILIDAMRSDKNYDPFYQYVVVRAGEYDYRIYFGPDINGNNLTRIIYQPQRTGSPASLSREVNKSLTINKNGFYYVGNVEGSNASLLGHQYALYFVLGVVAVFILIIILFKHFKRSEGSNVKYYSVR